MSDAPSFIESERIARATKAEHAPLAAPRRKPLLPDKAILALAVVADVAVHCRNGRVTGGMLARRRGLSSRYLEPMLQTLVQHGILKGMRGQHGGYRLGRGGERISAADILRAAVDEMRREQGGHTHPLDRTIASAVAQVEEVFSEALARISLADLTGSAMRTLAE